MDRLETALLGRLDALERRLQASPVSIVSEGEEHDLLKEIDDLASTADHDSMRSLLARYLEWFGQSPNAPLVQKMQRELEVIGRPSPEKWALDLVYQGPPGAGLDGPGVKVLLFWEVWCPHCRRELPRMQEIYPLLKESNVDVVGLTRVSGEATDEQVRAFINEHGITYPVAREDGSVSERFGVMGVPAAAVVSKGVILWRGHPARLSPRLLKDLR